MTAHPKPAPSDHPYARVATRIQRAKGLCGVVNNNDGEPGACIRPRPCEVHGGEVGAVAAPEEYVREMQTVVIPAIVEAEERRGYLAHLERLGIRELVIAADTERTMHNAWRKRAEEAEAELAALREQNRALVEALRPFASYADRADNNQPLPGRAIIVGDFRVARRALSPTEPPEK
jgi:hypothetical protein